MVNPVGQRGRMACISANTCAAGFSSPLCLDLPKSSIYSANRGKASIRNPFYELVRSPIRAAFITENW